MELLIDITERQPGLIFDICDRLAIPARDTTVTSPPPQTTNPSWCTCNNCQEMPTDREKLCYRLLPQNCLSLRPVIPSCIVCKVRRRYPDPNGQYTGFKADKWA
ncbi:uncharacterized protein LOC126809741 [Patella vulgata]|uniref:uncharacterized protein LOC126809741 n=1 Tax=Patella vulgata TaxID=6465 RepID=UPI0024A8D3B5|nr:uncharacterized protein LOC126809741 [Patella vulgata]